MVESYKLKSKIATAIGGIATIISIIGVVQLQAILPQYAQYIPVIVAIATWYVSQTTENKRVQVAEQLVHEQYEDEKAIAQTDIYDNDAPVLNDEYITGDDDGSC